MGYYEELLDMLIDLDEGLHPADRYKILVPSYQNKSFSLIFPSWDTSLSYQDGYDFVDEHLDSSYLYYRKYLIQFEHAALWTKFDPMDNNEQHAWDKRFVPPTPSLLRQRRKRIFKNLP